MVAATAAVKLAKGWRDGVERLPIGTDISDIAL